MRIIAGELRGRNFDAPKSHRTHPMSEKMRGALFNALGDIEGLTVLDAFAGSGALSFEAISRGAKSALAIDHDKFAYLTIQKNITNLGLNKEVKAKKANANGWSNNNTSEQFDLVILDPPYFDVFTTLLQKLTRHARNMLVLSWPGNENPPNFENLEVITKKNYGDAQLVFYRKIK